MKLYYSPGACSQAAHIILNELNIKYVLERVDLKAHVTENGADYYTINPKGYVPALEVETGQILTENVAVLPFLASQANNNTLLPHTEFGRAQLSEMLGYINSEIHPAYGYFFKNELNEAEKIKGYQKIDHLLNLIDLQLEKSKHDYLVENKFGPADAYFFVVTHWSNYIGHDLSKFKSILKLRDLVLNRSSVQKTLSEEGF